MKYIYITILISFFVSCDYDNANGTMAPTQFKGSIIYSENNEPFQGGSINISGVRNDFPTNQTIIGKDQRIESDGSFNIEFEGNDTIDRFIITVLETLDVGEASTFNEIDCMGMDCDKIDPGQVYNDFIIRLR